MEMPEERAAGGPLDPTAGILRAVDAAANRAGEALRVLEDVVRFVLDDGRLTAVAKNLRHDLAAVLVDPDLADRVRMRDVAGDVGAGLEAAARLPRASCRDLLAANAARAGQALRSLEETSALFAPGLSPRFEALRYRLYALEKAVVGTARAIETFDGVTLCVLVDGRVDATPFARLVESLFEAGVRMIQIRDKALAVPLLVDRVRSAVAIARRRRPDGDGLVVVNDRVDVARVVAGAGVHVGAADLPTSLARLALGPARVLGRTAHDSAEVRSASGDGADYIGVGPCFPSMTKSFGAFAGKDFLAAVARETALPAFAIGGVTLERLDELLALGLRRVAVASAIVDAVDPAAAATAFMERLAAQRPTVA